MASRSALPIDVRIMNGLASALFLGVALSALGTAGWWVAHHPSWSMGRIVVEGEVAHQSAASVRAYLAPQLRGSFLTLDLQEVKRLFETLPWVRQAVVRREFPNRLHVTLQEHEAVAWWGEAGGGKLVNRQGAVFEADPDPGQQQSDAWPELIGPADQPARAGGQRPLACQAGRRRADRAWSRQQRRAAGARRALRLDPAATDQPL